MAGSEKGAFAAPDSRGTRRFKRRAAPQRQQKQLEQVSKGSWKPNMDWKGERWIWSSSDWAQTGSGSACEQQKFTKQTSTE